jgi:hypothetical protein
MSRVVSARKIKDRLPRWLWELRPECGHFHYEKVESYPQQPVHVICRVCTATKRLASYRARVASASDGGGQVGGRPPVLSGSSTEGAQKPLVLDGGIAIPQQQAVQGVAPAEIPQETTAWAHRDGQAAEDNPEYRGDLPSCMRPRPGAPAPRRVAGAAGEGSEDQAGVAGATKVHRRYRKRGPDPNQTRLFE